MIKKIPINQIDNIVRISDDNKLRDYLYATAIRMRPEIYNKYDCIIWQILGSKLAFAKSILYENGVKYWGLVIEPGKDENGDYVDAVPTKLKGFGEGGGGYILDNGYQITLKKIYPIKNIE